MPDACGEIPRPAPKETAPTDRILAYVKTLHMIEDGLKVEQLAYERSGNLNLSTACFSARRDVMSIAQRITMRFRHKVKEEG